METNFVREKLIYQTNFNITCCSILWHHFNYYNVAILNLFVIVAWCQCCNWYRWVLHVLFVLINSIFIYLFFTCLSSCPIILPIIFIFFYHSSLFFFKKKIHYSLYHLFLSFFIIFFSIPLFYTLISFPFPQMKESLCKLSASKWIIAMSNVKLNKEHGSIGQYSPSYVCNL